MGFSCETAHPRTTTSRPSEQHRFEPTTVAVSCEQLQPQTPNLDINLSSSSSSISNNKPSRKHQHQHTFHRGCALQSKHPPPSTAAPSSGSFPEARPSRQHHYPFNLFHPFHDSTTPLQQYSTIILDKLSQFITKHVAARSVGSAVGSRNPPDVLLPWSTTCPHPRNTSDKPVLPAVNSECSSSNSRTVPADGENPSPTPLTGNVPPEPAPATTTTCDPLAAATPPPPPPVAYLELTESESSSQTINSDAGSNCSSNSSNHRQQTTLTTTTTCGTTTTGMTGTGTTNQTRPATSSHYLVRHSLCLYAASSVILALCYLTIPTVASDTPHTIFAEGKSDKEILDHLLKGSRYDKRLLPPVDDADFCCGMQTPEMAKHMPDTRVPGRPQNRGSLTVNVSVLLLSLASPDESSLKYEVEFLLQQQWYDPRLRYANQSSYEFLNAIHHHEDIWLPDTYFIMHGDFKDPIIPMHFALRIFRNGTINYLMRRHLILSCQGRLNIFPFDDPLCSFALESISYEQSAIRYVWKNDEDTLRKSPSLTTLNAYLIQNQTITCPIKASWRGNYSCLKVDLIFTRDRAFYFTTVFIPGIILVTSSFITFWLEWNAVPARSMIGNYSCLKVDLMFTRDRAFYFTTVFIPGIILVTSSFITFWLEWNAVPARVMIGVTTMLNFFTTSNGFRSTLPVVSNLTAMNVWDGVCMCFIYASLLEFVCVNYVGRKRPLHNVVYRPGENPVTQRLPAVLNRIGIILASPLSKTYPNEQETIENEFHMAIAAEKSTSANAATAAAAAAAAAASSGSTATSAATAAEGRKTPTSASTASPAPSRPASSIMLEEGLGGGGVGGGQPRVGGGIHRQPTVETKLNESGLMETSFGVKKRESGGPNEIVACTSCAGGTSPCTHSANNGCATETCFVQVRKKEPPHPIRVAKTIDVIARITFPSAYAVFLIFFFIHYKGFS